MTHTIVIGLDCASPRIVFDLFADAMPTITALRKKGVWGNLRSCAPPITVPAWTVMVSGKDPGELGLYGFRSLINQTYQYKIASSHDVHVKRIWDYLGEAGQKSAALFVPLTYPPTPIRGVMTSCFLTPTQTPVWTFPPSLSTELESLFGSYQPDVSNFRKNELEIIYENLVSMTKQHFAITRYILKEKHPDFLMMVEIGTDRLHHAFYRYIDPLHPQYCENQWTEKARAYYALIDQEIAQLIQINPEANIIIVSDHGAKPMFGGFCINDWLIQKGWLTLVEQPSSVTSLTDAHVDWSKTKAWAEGGYYSRIYLNVINREPSGTVDLLDYQVTRQKLIDDLMQIENLLHPSIQLRIDIPENTYKKTKGRAPDLLIYFDNLNLRAIGSVGHQTLFEQKNDTGHDECNHDWDGILIAAGPQIPNAANISTTQITQITPLLLNLAGIQVPSHLSYHSPLSQWNELIRENQ